MFENMDSTTPEKYWLLWASLKAITLGVGCFFLALFLSPSGHDPMVEALLGRRWASRAWRHGS
jgi:hypothetical protein